MIFDRKLRRVVDLVPWLLYSASSLSSRSFSLSITAFPNSENLSVHKANTRVMITMEEIMLILSTKLLVKQMERECY